MAQTLLQSFEPFIQVDILREGAKDDLFIGRPFYLDYFKANILVCDAWKHRAKGIPQGTFLLAFYDGEPDVEEALLLRAIGPTRLPTDNEMIGAMIEYYKDDLDTSGRAGAASSKGKLDEFTRYEFSFSGLECRVLGSFYKIQNEKKEILEFGADIENFFSANNYRVYKATSSVLQRIVNQRDGDDVAGGQSEFPIGYVRYSSSRRFQGQLKEEEKVRVYVSPKDFLGKRTAMFGMTRTGKSNTVKKIIEATVEISHKAKSNLTTDTQAIQAGNSQNGQGSLFSPDDMLEPFQKDGSPKYPVGQIIFDVNGEYANANMQDEGTAIFELYSKETIRYSVLSKPGFKVMKTNFYTEVEAGFELIRSYFRDKKESSDYVNNFLAIGIDRPDDYDSDQGVKVRYDRLIAAYFCCLHKAKYPLPKGFQVKFQGAKEINALVRDENPIDPSRGINLDEATIWFTRIWENHREWDFFEKYKKKKGRPWADEDLRAVLAFLTRKKEPGRSANVSGFRKLNTQDLKDLHTPDSDRSFEEDIVEYLRKGKIVIVDLSQGSPTVKTLYSEKLCSRIFDDAMNRFIHNWPNNFLQFYFEEAHNLFPKKEDKNLSQIYNRIAKEGAKLNLGMIYATQEVSSISSNILKNTQNWFIAHLNNEDELREIKKYYDFADFTASLVRFSARNDKGFVRMKTYTNPFVVPVQVDRFLANQSQS